MPGYECLAPELRTWPRPGFNAPKLAAPRSGNRALKGANRVRISTSHGVERHPQKRVLQLEKHSSNGASSMFRTTFNLFSDEEDAIRAWSCFSRSLGSVVLPLAAICGIFMLAAPEARAFFPDDSQGVALFGDLDEIKNGFTLAFLLIFFSELGDKTFFIAAILATRKSNFAVFTGTFGALVAMTFISVTLGRAFHYIDGILPFSLGNTEIPIDDVAAVVLLVYFGVSTLVDAASMESSKADEEQQEAELAVAGVNGGGNTMSNVVVATFALVFVAEWGDKSFFSTIALAAASSPIGVVAGAIAGHGAATLLAVLGGSILGNYISEKVIASIGGSLFLIFAAETLFEIFSGSK